MKKIFYITTLVLAFSLNAYSQDYTGYNGCALQDSLALVAFYNATDGPNWISNQDGFSIDNLSDDVLDYYTNPDHYPNAGLGKWLEGPVKDWFGVTLEKQQIGNGPDSAWRVIHLHPTLSRRSAGDNNLIGYVPKEVGLLTALTWFKVNGNNGLKGSELPDELYHPTIQALDFESCYFSGILSSALRNCTKLDYPNFRYNNFDSIPLFDFVSENPKSGYYFYQNRISWATLEPTVEILLNKGFEYEARDQHDVGRETEIVVTPGSSATLKCTEAGTQGTVVWNKNGADLWDWTDPVHIIESVSASDTGYYKCTISNEYIRLNDANADYSKTQTKPIHLTFIPSVPVIKSGYTSYDGNLVYMKFSKPMVFPSVVQATQFSVKRNGADILPVNIDRTGRLNNILILELGESLNKGDTVTVSYTKGSIVDVNGGELNSFTTKSVTNYVRETPNLVSAVTRKDGEGIELEFDHFVDPATFNPDDFTINATKNFNVEEVILNNGEINENISRKLTLVPDETVYSGDTVSVSYNKGSLAALYGASVQSFSDQQVENIVDSNRVNMNLRVIDGSGLLDQVVIKGQMKILPFRLYDNGTSGDETSEDNTWTRNMQLIEGAYQWKVYNRKTVTVYDTVKTVDSETGVVTITVSPVTSYLDSLISGNTLLTLNVDFDNKLITGDTIFKYRTNSVVFVLDMKNYLAENPGETIDPFVMGIKGDWIKGIPMTDRDTINPDSTYIAVASGYNIGDVINFNFRNGGTWENSTSRSRVDTVSENDTVYVVFEPGVLSTEISEADNSLIVYPNPVDKNDLTVYLPDSKSPKKVVIYNLYGQQILSVSEPTELIDLSSMQAGIYIISATDNTGKKYRSQFIKK